MYNKKIKLYSPEIDNIIERNGNCGFHNIINDGHFYQSKKTADILRNILNVVQYIKPHENGQDKSWSLWIQSERGPLSAFVNDEEYNEMKETGEIESFEDLQSLWKSYYPEEIKWYNVSFILYEKEFFLIFNSKLHVKIDIDTGKSAGAHFEDDEQITFFTWILTKIENEVTSFITNPTAYNKFISENLPLCKRLGKIKRMTLWKNMNDAERLDKELGLYNLKKFEKIVNIIKEEKVIKEMTADDYFYYCAICYDANEYFKDLGRLIPRDKYRKMADGRDEGLLAIQGDSSNVFENWYETRSHSGHPWEICRGGNTTHISLSLHRSKEGWVLYLNGSSRVRAVETAKMAIALFENNIPFILVDAEQMRTMFKGEDYLGIVPEDIIPKYCHSYFPEEDKIHDFINPWHDEDIVKVIKNYAKWYPIETLEIKK